MNLAVLRTPYAATNPVNFVIETIAVHSPILPLRASRVSTNVLASVTTEARLIVTSRTSSMLPVGKNTFMEDYASVSLTFFFFEWGFYALSASKAIFRARTYNCITYSVR